MNNPSSFRYLKAWHTLRAFYHRFSKKKSQLSPQQQATLQLEAQALLEAMEQRKNVNKMRTRLHKTLYSCLPKSSFEHLLEFCGAIIFALVVATLIRTVWFEFYEIPTGSMRPTFQEQDHLIASKTTFGLNVPLEEKHFYFDPAAVERNKVVIFTVGDLPVSDPETTYFWLFRGKRLLVKRLIGKPKDRLYFYGGKIYGRDEAQNPFLIDFEGIDHVPFISFEGEVKADDGALALLQTQQKLGKVPLRAGVGKLWVQNRWRNDAPDLAREPHQEVVTYSDFWGFKNFAVTRLFTQEEMKAAGLIDKEAKDSFYLQLQHHPSLTFPSPIRFKSGFGKEQLLLVPQTTFIGLDQVHLNRLMDNLYTGRFVVKGGRASRYLPGGHAAESLPLPGVPDGTYEFQAGKAYSVAWAGVQEELPHSHPIYTRTPLFCQTLFNAGFEFTPAILGDPLQPWNFSQRFAYFVEGNLLVMGKPLFTKEEKELQTFIEKEKQEEKNSSALRPYLAFVDTPPPLEDDGGIDRAFLNTFGMEVPASSYFVLGDNYAMSGDSRAFGFVPQQYLKGSPLFTLWPIGSHWGPVRQPSSSWWTLPNGVVVIVLALITTGWALVHHRRCKKLEAQIKHMNSLN